MTTALITGASSGLGYDFAHLFAKDNHSLILVARREELLNNLAAELKTKYPSITVNVIAMDLGIPGAGQNLFDRVKSLNTKIDYLVNNAGFGTNGAFYELPVEKELQMVDLNMRTLLELTSLFLPAMVKRKSGRILNVGSCAGFQPGPYMATYYATKAFVNSFSEALSNELKDTGVTCTVLAPGATATEFAQAADITKSKLFTLNAQATSQDVALCGYQAMLAGKTMAIPGFTNKALPQMQRFVPRFAVRKITEYLNKQ